jgi:hypothetical protein
MGSRRLDRAKGQRLDVAGCAMTITPDQKREYREARQQAQAGIERLNELFAATGRTYRVHLEFGTALPLLPAADDFADLDDDDAEPGYGRGRERAEAEDEI